MRLGDRRTKSPLRKLVAVFVVGTNATELTLPFGN